MGFQGRERPVAIRGRVTRPFFVCVREWGIIPHAIKIGGVLVACGGGGGVDVTWVQWVWRNRYVAVRHRMLSRIPVRAREAWQKVNLSGTDYPSMVAIGPRIGYPPRSMPRKSAGWSRKVPSLHQALIQYRSKIGSEGCDSCSNDEPVSHTFHLRPLPPCA
jgi:hypothetical protein